MLNSEEVKRILSLSFFDINQEQYDKYKEYIDIILSLGNHFMMAEYDAKEKIKDNAENEEDEKMIYIGEGVINKGKFLRSIDNKYSLKDILICLEDLQEDDMSN